MWKRICCVEFDSWEIWRSERGRIKFIYPAELRIAQNFFQNCLAIVLLLLLYFWERNCLFLFKFCLENVKNVEQLKAVQMCNLFWRMAAHPSAGFVMLQHFSISFETVLRFLASRLFYFLKVILFLKSNFTF